MYNCILTPPPVKVHSLPLLGVYSSHELTVLVRWNEFSVAWSPRQTSVASTLTVAGKCYIGIQVFLLSVSHFFSALCLSLCLLFSCTWSYLVLCMLGWSMFSQSQSEYTSIPCPKCHPSCLHSDCESLCTPPPPSKSSLQGAYSIILDLYTLLGSFSWLNQ